MAAKNAHKRKKDPSVTTAGGAGVRGDTPTLQSRHKPPASAALTGPWFSSRPVWVAIVLTILNIFIYASVRHHNFLAWDDPEYLSENPLVTAGLTWSGFQWAFTTGHMGNWNPLTWLSYMLGVQLFGLAAGPQLLINLGFHVLSTLLLFGLLNEMTGALWRSASVAALFAVHPLHVESVAWVSERKDVLSAFLGLLTLWAWLGYTRRPGILRYLILISAFIAALMAKPMVVTLPFLMLLLDYWPLRRVKFEGGGMSGLWVSAMPAIREKLPLFAVALLSGVVTFIAQQRGGAVAGLTKLSFGFRIENALVSYVAYIGKMFWPVNLSPLYPLHLLPALVVAGSAIVLFVVSVAAIRWGNRRPWFAVGWLWYVITLLPVIGLVQVGSQAMADRYTYLPLIGLFIILAWGLAELTARTSHGIPLVPVAASALILVCVFTARAQVEYWRDSLTLWTHAVQLDAVSDTSQRLLADALSKIGRYPESIPHYSEALRLNPDNAEAHTGLGYALAGEGKFADAIGQYSESLRLKPGLFDAHNDLAIALASQGRVDEAIGHYREALRIRPYIADAHSNLGVALTRQGRTGEAVAQFEEALRLQPDNSDAHNNLGITLANQGRIDDAIAHFQRAVELRSDFESARNNLKFALSEREKKAAKR